MAVNVKMGVDLGGFKSGIQQGTQILKGLNAEMKATEAEFKATGNAEQKMASQTKNLTSQIQVQKGIVDQAQKALDAMAKAGIDPADKAYQQMYATMMKAQQGMYEAQAALNSLGESAQQAAGGANDLVTSVNSIGKKISLDQVISGIGSITGALETAAGKAVQLGETIWNAVMDRAQWADDTQTMALMYGIDVDTLQRMQKLVTNGLDTTVDAILTAQSRLKRGVGSGSIADDLRELHLTASELQDTGGGILEFVRKDSVDLFWEAGQAIMNLGDEYEKEEKAQKLFGRGWKELVPLFSEYKSVEEYRAALEKVNVSSDEDINNMATLNDKISELKGNLEQLSTDILAQLAPGLSTLADALNGVLTEIIEYLKTDKGKEMLQSLGDAVSGLFGDLSKIDPEKVVSGFVEVFTKVTGGIQWLVDNAETAKGILATVVGAWGTLKLGETVLKVVNLVDGIKGLTAADAASAGAAAGGSWASAFASAAMAAAPFLAFLYTMLNPAGTAGNDADTLYANGQVTSAGWDSWRATPEEWENRIMQVGNRYGSLSEILANNAALNIIGNSTIGIDEVFRQLEEQLGFEPLEVPYEMTPQENVTEQITEQVGVVEIPAQLVVTGVNMGGGGGVNKGEGESGGGGGGKPAVLMEYANGLPFVPYDGYLAMLHKGERVMTARENVSQNFSSNLYVENMNMGGGLSADALAESIARRNRRVMAGYGS